MEHENIDETTRYLVACENVKKIVNAIKSIKIKYYPNFAKISVEDKKIYEQLEANLEKISEDNNLNRLKVALMEEVSAKYDKKDIRNESRNPKFVDNELLACYGAIDAQQKALSRGKIKQAKKCQDVLKQYLNEIDSMSCRELVINYPEILEFSSVYEDYLREDTANKFWLVNTNKLVRFYEGADGLKTGHTDAAKYCLAATAKKNNLRFIAVVLGEENSSVRNQETMNLLDYGFNHYQMNLIKSKGDVLKKISLDKATEEKISLIPISDIGVITEKSNKKHNYTYEVKTKDFQLPIKQGDIVGKVVVKDGEKEIISVPLTVSDSVYQLSFLQLFGKSIKDLVSGNFAFSFE